MTDLRSGPRNPFGPRQPGLWGALLRAAQWGLTILTVICMWPGVMLVFTALTDFLPLLRGGLLPPASTLRIHGAWCLWTAMLVLTGLRISGQWFRWWAFLPVTAAYAAMEMVVMPDAADPVGLCIWQMMLGVAALQVLLHAVWSLCAAATDAEGAMMYARGADPVVADDCRVGGAAASQSRNGGIHG